MRGFDQCDIGKVIENALYLKLAGEGWDIRSGRAGDREIDFVCERSGTRIYAQAVSLVPDGATREREFGSLLGFRDAWPRCVVSMDPLRADCVGRRRRATREDAAERGRNSLMLQVVLVFGGVARSGEGSDLDLLIVVDEKSVGEDALAAALQPFQKRFAVDPFVIPANIFRDHFQQGSPFLRAVIREGRRLYMKNAESEWLKDSLDELKAAEYLFTGGYWKAACFHSQQAVEKVFKARLLGLGWELEKVHSIARLQSLAVDYKISLALEAGDIQFIDSIYRGRCPGEAGLLPLGEPTKVDAESAIEIAKRALGN